MSEFPEKFPSEFPEQKSVPLIIILFLLCVRCCASSGNLAIKRNMESKLMELLVFLWIILFMRHLLSIFVEPGPGVHAVPIIN